MRVPYTFVDAFIQNPLMGNPIAIVPRAETLDELTMQRIAEELDQAATTFILPPKSDFADWRLRTFTAAGKEVFGAGHNSLSAWWWLAESGGLTLSEGRNQFTQEIGGECLPVEVRCEHRRPVTVALTHLSPVYGAICADLPKLADALGVETEDIIHWDKTETRNTRGHQHRTKPAARSRKHRIVRTPGRRVDLNRN